MSKLNFKFQGFNAALIYKDLKRCIPFSLLYLAFYFFLCVYTYKKNMNSLQYYSFNVISPIFFVFAFLLPFVLFYDEKSNDSKFFTLSLPVSKDEVVKTKYFFGLFILIINFIIVFLLNIIFITFTKFIILKNFYVISNYQILDSSNHIIIKMLSILIWCTVFYNIVFFTMFFYKNIIQTLIIIPILFFTIFILHVSFIYDFIYKFINKLDFLNLLFRSFKLCFINDSYYNIYYKLFFVYIFLFIPIFSFIVYKLSKTIYNHSKNESNNILFQNKFSQVITTFMASTLVSFILADIIDYDNINLFLTLNILFYYIFSLILKKLKLGGNSL